MAKDSKNTEGNTKRGNPDNLAPAWKEGQKSPNPNGRPKGQRNYRTIYLEALRKIGEANGKTPEEMEVLFQEVGLKNAIKGNFQFWKDINDRTYGKTPDNTNVHVTTEPSDRIKNLAKKLNK